MKDFTGVDVDRWIAQNGERATRAHIGEFITDTFRIDAEKLEPSSWVEVGRDAYQLFLRWCFRNEELPVFKRKFRELMTGNPLANETTFLLNGVSRSCYAGLVPLEPFDPKVETWVFDEWLPLFQVHDTYIKSGSVSYINLEAAKVTRADAYSLASLFISELDLVPNPLYWTAPKMLFDIYVKWCSERAHSPSLSIRELENLMIRLGFFKVKYQRKHVWKMVNAGSLARN